MELIPIIKYALTVVSGIALVVIGISYALYKIKNNPKKTGNEMGYSLVPAGNNSFTQNQPEKNLLTQVMQKQQVPYRQERVIKPVAVKKPARRFMVINQNQNSYRHNPATVKLKANNLIDDPSSRQGLNIMNNNYSSNSAEPLKRFGF